MKRIICAAAVALTLMLVSSPEAKANDWTFRPGYFSLNGSLGFQWAGGGIQHFNAYYYGNPNQGGYGSFANPYASPGNYSAFPAGPGRGYGYGAPSFPQGYGYGTPGYPQIFNRGY